MFDANAEKIRAHCTPAHLSFHFTVSEVFSFTAFLWPGTEECDCWVMSSPPANMMHVFCTWVTWDLCTPQNYISYFAWYWSMFRRKTFMSWCVERRSASSCANSKPLFLLHANKTWYTVGTEVLMGVVLSGETEALPNISSSSWMSVEVTNESTIYYLLCCNGK